MNAMPYLDVICDRMAKTYRKVYGDAVRHVFLYGSYARGDFDEESDIDFAAIVEGERQDLQKKCHEVWNATNKMDLEYDIVTQATVIPWMEFEKYKDVSGYYRNIATEGKKIE